MARPLHGLGPRLVLLAVDICDDVFEGGNRLLDISNLSELVVADGADAVLQRDDHLSPALLQLHEWQSMIGRILHLHLLGLVV